LDHEPADAVRMSPTTGVPEIDGAVVTAGAGGATFSTKSLE
jgi:hypothetical protein